jgi:hypothetical protein
MKYQEEQSDDAVLAFHLFLTDNGVDQIQVDHQCYHDDLYIHDLPNCASNQILNILTEILESYSEVKSLVFTLKYSQNSVLSKNFARFSLLMEEDGYTSHEALQLTPLGKAAIQLGFSRTSTPIVNDKEAYVKFKKV